MLSEYVYLFTQAEKYVNITESSSAFQMGESIVYNVLCVVKLYQTLSNCLASLSKRLKTMLNKCENQIGPHRR